VTIPQYQFNKTKKHTLMLHVRAVDDLNGACTIMDDWMMLVTTQLGLRHVRDFTDFDGFFSGIKECGNERLNGLTCGGYAVSLGANPACSALDIWFS